jgi:predicted nucleic acid-binding protein
LDTNVISETRKIRANSGVMAFLSKADGEALFLSVLTLGELRKGVEAKRRTTPAIAELLGAWVDGLETTFAHRVLAIDVATARCWGELSAGRSLPVIDTLIAATAIGHGSDDRRSMAGGMSAGRCAAFSAFIVDGSPQNQVIPASPEFGRSPGAQRCRFGVDLCDCFC